MNRTEHRDKLEWVRKKAETLLRSARPARMFWDSVDALSLCYASGKQWRYVASGSSGKSVQRIKEVIDPGRKDIRVTLDRTARMVRKATAALKPRKMSGRIQVVEGLAEALSAKPVYEQILREVIRETKGLGVYRSNQLPRVVLGTSYIRRQIRANGKKFVLPAEMQTDKQRQATARDLQCGWSVCLPWEVIRDPAARNADFEDWETIFAVEKPWSLNQILRQFPDARTVKGEKLDTETTYGELMQFESEIHKVSGREFSLHAADSEQKAMVVYEFLLKDDDEPGDWVWQYIAAYDPKQRGENGASLASLHLGRNPHYGSFLHGYHYEKQVNSPRGRGLPLCLKQLQDITNISWTSVCRVLLDHANPRWVYQEGSIEKPEETFTDRADVPIAYRVPTTGQNIPPSRVGPGQGSPVAQGMVEGLADEMRDAANLAAVQFGEMIKRGQSARAYEVSLEQAEGVLDDVRQDDEITTGELLLATLLDQCQLLSSRPDRAVKLLGGRFPVRQIAEALSGDPKRNVEAVTVNPDALRNRSPGMIKDEFTQAVGSQLLSPEDAQWEILVQADTALKTGVARARRTQIEEIQQILAGGEPEVYAFEEHAVHLRTLKEEVFDNPEIRSRLTPEQKDAFEQHAATHMQHMQDFALWSENGQQMQQAAPQGSVPAGEPQMPIAAPGSVGAGVSVG